MDRRSVLSAIATAPVLAAISPSDLLAGFLRSPDSPGGVSASMWTYLWDLVDEGYENVLTRLKDHGLTSISIATAYHAGKFLAPHNPKRKVVFLEDGTVYFRPDLKLYGRVKPLVNSLVQKGHGLAAVKKAADKLGLKTRAWVVCCHNTPLGMTYPGIACENVFGDKLYHNLCPSNPDVRTFIRALVKDIAGHGIDAIELEALQFQGYTHGFHHEREGIELTGAARFLLGLCFCPACVDQAARTKFDIRPIRAFTRITLEAFFSDPAPVAEKYGSVDTLPADLFDPFLEWRKSIIVSLLEELAEASRTTKLRPLMHVDPLPRKLVSVDPQRSSAITGGILALGYVRDGAALRSPLSTFQKVVGPGEITVGLQVGLPESGGRKEFLERMTVAKELGIRSFNFYNYGFVPYEHITWITEGLRA